MLISIATGIAAGAVHVVGGADHLVAMTPTALRHPRVAFRDGLAWGVGHSTGVLCLSGVAVIAKDLVHIQRMSSLAEFSVGMALLVVGGLTIRTALGLDIHTHSHRHGNGENHDHIHLHFRGRKRHRRHTHAVTGLGVLHGLAGASHLLAVIPALALPPIAAIAYMAAYLFGSIATMGIFLLALSFASSKVGIRSLPFVFGFAGLLSIFTGLAWIHKTSIQVI